MKPYYEDEQVSLFNAKCQDILPTLADSSVKCVITDPPYSERTHAQAKTNKGRGHDTRSIGFASLHEAELTGLLAECGRVSDSWVIATLDYRHALHIDEAPPAGMRCLRVGVWVKPNPMPQISGDRPGQGWEAIAFLHRSDVKPTWRGGGRSGVWIAPVAQNEGHPTAKPLSMVSDWVRLFTAPGDTILDPFCGSGTTLRAAKNEGRRAIGVEIDEAFCEITARRLEQGVLDFGEAS